jgi:hypothetical protein
MDTRTVRAIAKTAYPPPTLFTVHFRHARADAGAYHNQDDRHAAQRIHTVRISLLVFLFDPPPLSLSLSLSRTHSFSRCCASFAHLQSVFGCGCCRDSTILLQLLSLFPFAAHTRYSGLKLVLGVKGTHVQTTYSNNGLPDLRAYDASGVLNEYSRWLARGANTQYVLRFVHCFMIVEPGMRGMHLLD